MHFTRWTAAGILLAITVGTLEAIYRMAIDTDPGPIAPRR